MPTWNMQLQAWVFSMMAVGKFPALTALVTHLMAALQWLNETEVRVRLLTHGAAQYVDAKGNTEPSRFPRTSIFDDVGEAIARCVQEPLLCYGTSALRIGTFKLVQLVSRVLTHLQLAAEALPQRQRCTI